MTRAGNLFEEIQADFSVEHITELVVTPNLKIERIVSRGHASPPGFWYDQDWAEWIVVLAGSAGLLLENETAPRPLRAGDFVHIPAHSRHRVEWTDAEHPTVWLAVHHL